MNHIELFAGCGGLSLGFKSEGFSLLFANELSPMAAETFTYNHLGENLQNIKGLPKKTFWIKSVFPNSNILARLREEPLLNHLKTYSDLETDSPKQFKSSLLVGSIVDLNSYLEVSPNVVDYIQSQSVDVVSGGPPCQSFSMAGQREKNNAKNQLPWEFARFVNHTKPKIALLENVTGILRPFTENGEKFHAWLEVAKAFAQINYVPICLHINAKYVGTAQNRPRYVMIAIRLDIAQKLRKSDDRSLNLAVNQGIRLYHSVQSGERVSTANFFYFDIESNSGFFNAGVFSPLATHKNNLTSVKDAIGDLINKTKPSSKYVDRVNTAFKSSRHLNKWVNHEERNNSLRVRARFRLYQIIEKIGGFVEKEVRLFLRDPDKYPLSKASINTLSKKTYIKIEDSTLTKIQPFDLEYYLRELQTKKQTQRALKAAAPAPAALSIPDDACHWDENQPRTLTVREMARIQSFPDWFEFKSKVTTGGKMRRFEVPQYTQVGNAVPPLLGKALAKVVKSIILAAGK